MPSTKPKNYNKLHATELDALLTVRGLPIAGTKLQKAARLFKDDAETSTPQKTSEQRAAAALMPGNRAGDNDLERGRSMSTVGRRGRGGGGEGQEDMRSQTQTGYSGMPELGVGGYPQPHEEEAGEERSSYRRPAAGAITVTPSTRQSIENTNVACGSAYAATTKTLKDEQLNKERSGKAEIAKYSSQKVEEVAAWIGDQEWSFVCVAVVVLMGLVLALLWAQVSRYWKNG